MRRIVVCITSAILCFGLALPTTPVSAAVVHDEEFDGDLSDDYAAPTIINLSPGSNVIAGTTGVSDSGTDYEYMEYVNVNLPPGHQLTALELLLYEGRDLTAFIGVQEGPAFTFHGDDAFSHINDMIGWSHIGPGAGTGVGSDLLPPLGENGSGFVPPLTGSSYTFWIQQTGLIFDYRLDFVVSPIPEPTGFVLAGMATLLWPARRRRSSSR